MGRYIMQYPKDYIKPKFDIITLPVVYSSKKAILTRLEKLFLAFISQLNSKKTTKIQYAFMFSGREMYFNDFIDYENRTYILPKVMSINEYFKEVESK